MVEVLWFMVYGLRFGVWDLGFRVYGLGLGVEGWGCLQLDELVELALLLHEERVCAPLLQLLQPLLALLLHLLQRGGVKFSPRGGRGERARMSVRGSR